MTEGGLADWGSESGLCKLLCDRDLGRVKVDPDSSDRFCFSLGVYVTSVACGMFLNTNNLTS